MKLSRELVREKAEQKYELILMFRKLSHFSNDEI